MRAVVVGAGVAGLVCGLRLRERGHEVVVLDGKDRPGGVVRTERLDGGWRIEHGPQSSFADPPLARLAAEHGVVLDERPRNERKRFLVRGGRLVPPWRALSLRGLGRALAGAVVKGAPPGEDETVETYVRRRFGEEALRRLFDPLVSGIFAGDPGRLAFKSALARFGQKRGPSVTIRGGMDELPAALARALGTALRLATPVLGVVRGPGGFQVHTGGGSLPADILVLACPAYAAGRLLEPLDLSLGAELEAIRYETVVAVSLGYDAEAFPAGPPRGFGFLVPREERLPILGCMFCAAPEGKVLLRAMMHEGHGDPSKYARDAVEPILGVRREPELVRVVRLARAIPQYDIGHAARLRRIEERLAPLHDLFLTGSAYHGIALADVIADAERVATSVAERA